jgi:hypothetical protein
MVPYPYIFYAINQGLSCLAVIIFVVCLILMMRYYFFKSHGATKENIIRSLMIGAMVCGSYGVLIWPLLLYASLNPVFTVEIRDGNNTLIAGSIYIFPGELTVKSNFGPFGHHGHLQVGNGTIVAEPATVALAKRWQLKKQSLLVVPGAWPVSPSSYERAREISDYNFKVANREREQFLSDINELSREYINSAGDNPTQNGVEEYVSRKLHLMGWELGLLEINIESQ